MATPPSRSGSMYDRGSLGHPSQSRRYVFFSFHYQQDIWRAHVVRNYDVVKRNHGEPRGYFDGSLLEKAKTEGKASVKRLIDEGLLDCSVTCVLIGKNTFKRHWVQYEIFKSIERGKGVFGVFINKIEDRSGCADARGTNPFQILGYHADTSSNKLIPCVCRQSKWEIYTETDPISAGAAYYLSYNSTNLSKLFKVYDWVDNKGYNNFANWVQMAAQQAHR